MALFNLTVDTLLYKLHLTFIKLEMKSWYRRGSLLRCDNWQIDLVEQICSRINQAIATDCRTFRERRPSSAAYKTLAMFYAVDEGLRGWNILQAVVWLSDSAMYLLIKTICYIYIYHTIYRRYCGVSNTCMYVLCSVANALCMFSVYPIYMCTWDVCTTCRGVHIALLLSVTSLEGTIPLCAVTIWPLHQTALVPCTQSVPIYCI